MARMQDPIRVVISIIGELVGDLSFRIASMGARLAELEAKAGLATFGSGAPETPEGKARHETLKSEIEQRAEVIRNQFIEAVQRAVDEYKQDKQEVTEDEKALPDQK